MMFAAAVRPWGAPTGWSAFLRSGLRLALALISLLSFWPSSSRSDWQTFSTRDGLAVGFAPRGRADERRCCDARRGRRHPLVHDRRRRREPLRRDELAVLFDRRRPGEQQRSGDAGGPRREPLVRDLGRRCEPL